MSKKNQPDVREAMEPLDAVEPEDAHPDLQVLIQAVKRRERQLVVARVLVDEFARAEGEEPDVAWRRFRRAVAIERISSLKKGDLSRTDVPGLMAEVERLSAER